MKGKKTQKRDGRAAIKAALQAGALFLILLLLDDSNIPLCVRLRFYYDDLCSFMVLSQLLMTEDEWSQKRVTDEVLEAS